MSFRDRNIKVEEKKCEKSVLGTNGSLTSSTTQFTIDENLLVDPKLLFIGSKIGEGAHGKVYKGRLVVKPWIYDIIFCIFFLGIFFYNIVFIMMFTICLIS
jgi:hypothetical protein